MHETTTTVRIFADGDFRIAIVETRDMYEYWLHHINHGEADMQFGLSKKQVTLEEFKEIIKTELEEDEEFYLDQQATQEYMWNNFYKEESK